MTDYTDEEKRVGDAIYEAIRTAPLCTLPPHIARAAINAYKQLQPSTMPDDQVMSLIKSTNIRITELEARVDKMQTPIYTVTPQPIAPDSCVGKYYRWRGDIYKCINEGAIGLGLQSVTHSESFLFSGKENLTEVRKVETWEPVK